jgi:hypothetical protein
VVATIEGHSSVHQTDIKFTNLCLFRLPDFSIALNGATPGPGTNNKFPLDGLTGLASLAAAGVPFSNCRSLGATLPCISEYLIDGERDPAGAPSASATQGCSSNSVSVSLMMMLWKQDRKPILAVPCEAH